MGEAYTIVAWPDTHVPEHDRPALSVMRQWLCDNKIDAIVNLGDLLDQKQISRFSEHIPEDQCGDLAEEWEAARDVISSIWKAGRANQDVNCKFWMLEGNHESRLKAFANKYPALRNVLDLRRHLGLRKDQYVESDSLGHTLRCEWRRPGDLVWMVRKPSDSKLALRPGVSFVHGLSTSVNHAKATADMFPFPGLVVYGHMHDFMYSSAKRFGVANTSAISAGWMGENFPGYVKGRATGWQHGFVVIKLDPATPGLFSLQMMHIHNGMMISPCGKVYRA